MSAAFAVDVLLALSAWIVLACGRVSLGTAAYVSVGAASTAAMLRHGWNPVEATATGVAAAGAAGYLTGMLLARVNAARFAIATLVVGLAVPDAISARIPRALPFHAVGAASALIAAGAAVVVVALILRSRDGSAFAAVAGDERAAQAVGMNPPALRCLAMTIGSCVGGLAGSVMVIAHAAVDLGRFALAIDVRAVAMAVIGGISGLSGPVIGAAVLDLAERAGGRLAADAGLFDAVALLFVVLLFPDGIVSLVRPFFHQRGMAR